MTGPLHIELARETEAIELARFVAGLGLPVRCDRTAVDIEGKPEEIGDAVTSWLATWHPPLVPTVTTGHDLALRPPAN